MPEREKRGEKLVTVPPFAAVDTIMKKLVIVTLASDSSRVAKQSKVWTYYAFFVEAPSPRPIVAVALFPVVAKAVAKDVIERS